MATIERAISRAESELVHVQSALDVAQHVLEAADQVAHTTGRRLFRLIRILGIACVVGAIAVIAAMLLARLSRASGRGDGDDTGDVIVVDQIQAD
jgi:hypothetical protein